MTHPDTHPHTYKLSLFQGRWQGTTHTHANPWTSESTCTGEWYFRFDKSGGNLIFDMDSPDFQAHGVFNLDPETKEVILFWFDSLGYPPYSPARGQWQDDQLLLVKTSPRGENYTRFQFSTNQFSYQVEAKPKGQESVIPIATGIYYRQRD